MAHIHGHSSINRKGKPSPTYKSWASMVDRCCNPNHKDYAYYGGRGLFVDESWRLFTNFLRDMGERPEGMTLERKDNDDGYYKENCCWATRKQQRLNRRLK